MKKILAAALLIFLGLNLPAFSQYGSSVNGSGGSPGGIAAQIQSNVLSELVYMPFDSDGSWPACNGGSPGQNSGFTYNYFASTIATQGAFANTEWSCYTPGKVGQGQYFQGNWLSWAYVLIYPNLGTGSFSVSAWVNLSNAGGFNTNQMQSVIDHSCINKSGIGSVDAGYALTISTFGDTASGTIPNFYTADNNGHFENLSSGMNLTVGTWYHLAAVWDGTKKYIYINGALVNSVVPTYPVVDATVAQAANGLTIGNGPSCANIAANPSGIGSFKGIIDEVRTYNYAQTSAQVLADYQKGANSLQSQDTLVPNQPAANPIYDQMTLTNGYLVGGTNLNPWGDSITSGLALSNVNQSYPYLLAAQNNWTLSSFESVAGYTLEDITNKMFSGPFGTQQHTILYGTNQAIYWQDTAHLAAESQMELAAYSWLALGPNILTGQNAGIATTGSWSNDVWLSGGGPGIYSTTNGSTASANVFGSGIIVWSIAESSTVMHNGSYTLTVDGNQYGGTYSGNFLTNTTSPYYGATLGATAVAITGLSLSTHTVVMTVTSASSASNPVHFLGIAGTTGAQTFNGPSVWVGTTPPADSAAYCQSSAYLGNSCSTDTVFATYRQMERDNVALLAAMGLPVQLVDVASHVIVPGDLNAGDGYNGLHPNSTGQLHIAQAFEQAMNGFVTPQNKQLSSTGLDPITSYPFKIINGSTGGTCTFTEQRNLKSGRKDVTIYFAAETGTCTYIFPYAFTNTPGAIATSQVAASVATSLSTTAVTVTGAASTGYLFLGGQ